MDIKNSFEVPLPVDETWKTLLDVPKIAPCMPGAELLEVVDPKTYKGKVSVRLGPVALSFVGTVGFVEIDEAARRATLKGQGTDAKGRGGASGAVAVSLVPVEHGTRVDVNTSVNLSGAVAQYGRGAGIIQDVATQIVGQFAACLRTMLERERAVASLPADASGAGDTEAASPPPQAKPISGLALIARVIWNSIRRLFGAA